MQFLMALLEHQVLLVILLMALMGFIAMTYEFILRLFGRKGMGEEIVSSTKARHSDDIEDDSPIPPELAKVPKPPTGPKDTLVGEEDIEGGEEVEDEDGNIEFHYIYKSDELAPSYWVSGFPSSNTESERTH